MSICAYYTSICTGDSIVNAWKTAHLRSIVTVKIDARWKLIRCSFHLIHCNHTFYCCSQLCPNSRILFKFFGPVAIFLRRISTWYMPMLLNLSGDIYPCNLFWKVWLTYNMYLYSWSNYIAILISLTIMNKCYIYINIHSEYVIPFVLPWHQLLRDTGLNITFMRTLPVLFAVRTQAHISTTRLLKIVIYYMNL
jgi:hypothetical protein